MASATPADATGPAETGNPYEFLVIPARRRALPSTALWWWRWEILFVALLAGLLLGPAHGVENPLLLALVVTSAGGLLAVTASRDWVRRRVWAVITQHRLRVGCAEAGILSPSGRVPTVLWTSVTRYGERVWLNCPSGVTIDDFTRSTDRLAVTCWAGTVTVRRVPGRRSTVVLDVIRNHVTEAVLAQGPGPEHPPVPAARTAEPAGPDPASLLTEW
jgi:hypothetical protein